MRGFCMHLYMFNENAVAYVEIWTFNIKFISKDD